MNNEPDLSLKNYIKELMGEKTREDGRKLMEYRKIKIEKNPLSQANGSARVKLGNTEVVVGVKLDVGSPYPDSPNEGVLITSAELSPIASSEFESGPPDEQSIELARVVDRVIRESKAIQFEKLCIKPKEKVWVIFVDIEIINDDGNLFDAAAIGAVIALRNAVFPKYDKKEEVVIHKEFTQTKLPVVGEPVLCTFGKIGDALFLDPTLREEESMDARLSIGVINGKICAMQKGGEGTFTEKEILELVELAIKKAEEIRKVLK